MAARWLISYCVIGSSFKRIAILSLLALLPWLLVARLRLWRVEAVRRRGLVLALEAGTLLDRALGALFGVEVPGADAASPSEGTVTIIAPLLNWARALEPSAIVIKTTATPKFTNIRCNGPQYEKAVRWEERNMLCTVLFMRVD